VISDFIYIAGSFGIALRRGDGVDSWCVLYRGIRADEGSENGERKNKEAHHGSLPHTWLCGLTTSPTQLLHDNKLRFLRLPTPSFSPFSAKIEKPRGKEGRADAERDEGYLLLPPSLAGESLAGGSNLLPRGFRLWGGPSPGERSRPGLDNSECLAMATPQ